MSQHSMQSNQGISRRKFIGVAAASLFAGVAITLTGCGSDDPVSVPPGDVEGEISSNHSHQITVTQAEIVAGEAVILGMQGGATHNHSITLTADDMASIKSGARVTKNSTTTNDHSHTVMFN